MQGKERGKEKNKKQGTPVYVRRWVSSFISVYLALVSVKSHGVQWSYQGRETKNDDTNEIYVSGLEARTSSLFDEKKNIGARWGMRAS